ncbi:MAG: hypothetical protein A2418_01175 [Candidatus Brennerbacteria bacterium RIFOXYC1_FULL_41_11]|nr:MAG: hypothetical protein A2418_01175 [Candidatus Brennerbacteria bacterium RIFOXYC1_FULL_41_11]
MYTVYVLYNAKHDKIYIGQTSNLEQRLNLHNAKTLGKKSYTAKIDGEWRLIDKEEYENRSMALKREKQLKSYRGREFVRNHSGVAQR